MKKGNTTMNDTAHRTALARIAEGGGGRSIIGLADGQFVDWRQECRAIMDEIAKLDLPAAKSAAAWKAGGSAGDVENFRISELQDFRVAGFQNFKIPKLQDCRLTRRAV